MNKKVIGIIIACVLIVAVVAVICVYVVTKNSKTEQENEKEQQEQEQQQATGAFKETTVTIEGYTINISSEEVGHPSKDSYFGTSFEIIDEKNNSSMYFVDFIGTKMTSEEIENKDSYSDIENPKKATINGKKYDYYISEDGWEALLCYQIPGEKKQLLIKVKGGDVFDSKGSQAKTLATVNEDVIESDELKGILNYSIDK